MHHYQSEDFKVSAPVLLQSHIYKDTELMKNLRPDDSTYRF